MKLKDLKLSELKRLCGDTHCSQCPIRDEIHNTCYFLLSRLPCQWRIKDETNEGRD